MGATLLSGCSRSAAPSGAPEQPAPEKAQATGPTKGSPVFPTTSTSPPQTEGVVQSARTAFAEQARELLPTPPAVPTTGSNAPMAAQVLGAMTQGGDADWAGLLKEVATNAASDWLGKLGGEVAQKLEVLRQAVGSDADAVGRIKAAVRALLDNQDREALALYADLKKQGLTPQQEQLAAEARNLIAAFLAGKRLEGIEGAEGQVSQLVDRLRQGDLAGIVPAARSLLQSAAPTPQQKDFIRTLVKQLTVDLGGLPQSRSAAPPTLPPVPGGP